MLDGKAYTAHFQDDPAYAAEASEALPRPDSIALREAFAALRSDFRWILTKAARRD